MPAAWKAIWGLSAASGLVLLALGVITIFNAADFCAAGSHYEWFWLTAATWCLLAPAGALLIARRAEGPENQARCQLIYLLGVIGLAAMAVIAWRVGAIDVPLFRDRDFPFGESRACAL